MTYQYAHTLVNEGPAHYVIPPVGTMRCPVHVWLSEELLASAGEPVWQQAAVAASYEGVTDVHLMPDTHLGFGVPIGCVVVTEGTLLQAAAGYDISCGVLHARIDDLHVSDIADPTVRREWIEAVEARIASGLGSHRASKAVAVRDDIEEVLLHGAAVVVSKAELERCERPGLPVHGIDVRSISRAWDKAAVQFGSIGSGNHFIELQVDPADGSVWVMLHCGSRGYGHQVATDFFFRGAELRDLPANRRETSWLRIDEPLGREYWAFHNAAANYAVANRHVIKEAIDVASRRVLGHRATTFYEISHNLIQEETLVLPDGSTRQGFVHRKGATRAFPAGHPQLVGTPWEATGHPVLAPGSMYEGAAILRPLPGAHATACSVNHGSGRLLGRGEAKRSMVQSHVNKEMAGVERVFAGVTVRGILSNCRDIPIDESRGAYKSLDAVLSVLDAAGVAAVERRLYPVANLKGMD